MIEIHYNILFLLWNTEISFNERFLKIYGENKKMLKWDYKDQRMGYKF